MARVKPYHSSNISPPHVYHDDDQCPTGKQIPAHNKRAGTNGHRRCSKCD